MLDADALLSSWQVSDGQMTHKWRLVIKWAWVGCGRRWCRRVDRPVRSALVFDVWKGLRRCDVAIKSCQRGGGGVDANPIRPCNANKTVHVARQIRLFIVFPLLPCLCLIPSDRRFSAASSIWWEAGRKFSCVWRRNRKFLSRLHDGLNLYEGSLRACTMLLDEFSFHLYDVVTS